MYKKKYKEHENHEERYRLMPPLNHTHFMWSSWGNRWRKRGVGEGQPLHIPYHIPFHPSSALPCARAFGPRRPLHYSYVPGCILCPQKRSDFISDTEKVNQGQVHVFTQTTRQVNVHYST